MRKRVLSLLLSVCMVLVLFPTVSSAYENYTVEGRTATLTANDADSLQSALNDSCVDEVVIGAAISLPDGTKLDGKGKTVRVPSPYVNENGTVNSGYSGFRVFDVAEGSTVSISNMTIMGGYVSSDGGGIASYGNIKLENVTFTRSNRGLMEYEGKAVLKNCNFVMNIRESAGAIWCGGGAKVVLDGCSFTNNHSSGNGSNGGGAIGVSGDSTNLFANNTVFANNATNEIGGAINLYRGNAYLINCTFTGNVTNGGTECGGAIGNNGGNLYAANCIFVDNYASITDSLERSDVDNYNSSANSLLYNCLYGTTNVPSGIITATDCKTDTGNETAFSYVDTGVTLSDGSTSVSFTHPDLDSGTNAYAKYVTVNAKGPAFTGGIATYFDYSDLSAIKMGYGAPESITAFSGLTAPDSSKKVETYFEGSIRSDGVIGASAPKNPAPAKYTVTWKSQDGGDTLETDAAVEYGAAPSFDGSAPTKAADANYNYTFAGWATSANQESGTAAASLPNVTGDVTYYAAFSKTVNKYAVTEDDWEYESDDNEGVKITKYKGSETEVNVPDELGGKPVTTIGQSAFEGCSNLQSVDMPNVTTIGESAFWGCSSLQGVDIPNVTTIGQSAFEDCSNLQSVYMPNVTTIGQDAFFGCSSLESVDMPNVETIGESAFWNCSSLQGVDIPNVTTIGQSAFRFNSSLESIIIPKSAASIGDCAFFGCSGLTCIVVAADNTVYDSRDNCNAIIEKASNKLIQGCKNTVIPNSVTSIGNNAFQLCSGLTGITIPSGVESIGNQAFYYSGLTSVTIAGMVTSIGDYAFHGCGNLKSVTILSDSATTPTFGEQVFYACSDELKIYCYEGSAAESYAKNNYISYKLLVKATRISLNETSLTMTVGENENLEIVTEPADAYTNINWTSSNTDVVTVDNTGKITAKGEGNATITATDEVSGCTATCTVTVKEPSGVWTVDIGDEYYTGQKVIPEIEVYDEATLLRKNVDYSLSYKNNVKAYTLSKGDEGFNEKIAPTITIVGKGNYAGTETVYFTIQPADISTKTFAADAMAVKATGKVQKPVPTLLWNGKSLAAKGNYSVNYYKANAQGQIEGEALAGVTEPGEYVIKLEGLGTNFVESKEIPLTVTAEKTLVSKLTIGKIANQTYTGTEIEPDITVKNGKTILTADDYIVTYSNNVNVGTASVLITGKGNYAGSKRINFNITGTALSKATVEGITSSVPYTGNDIEFDSIRLYIKATKTTPEKPLTKDIDYTVSYSKNQDAGTATVLFTGIGGYTGTVKKTFKITPYKSAVDDTRISVSVPESVEYSKGGAKPAVTVEFINSDGTVRTLTEKTDYTLAYQKNTAVNDCSNAKNMPAVKVTLKGSYNGTISKNFKIVAKDISSVSMDVADKTYANKKNSYASAPTLTDTDGKKLAAGKDYEKVLTYRYKNDTTVVVNGTEKPMEAGTEVGKDDIIPAGTWITVTAKGIGNYEETISGDYRITQSSVTSAKVTVPAQEYTGKPITINEENMTVKVGKDTLTTGEFEIVEGSYQNNTNKGTASFIIRGKGNYGGTKKVTFSIKTKVFKWWWR